VKGRTEIRKTILAILGSAPLVATSVQFAAAAQRHHGKAMTRAVITSSSPAIPMPMLPGTLRTSSPTCLAIPAGGRRQPVIEGQS
jgi:hypothetical protein